MADLRRFRTLARNWEALGETDPLFGVLSDPAKYGGKWDPAEFFESGRAHVQKLWRVLGDAGATFEPGTCLDFGCGVGRLTIPLSERFQHTIGLDVAGPMVDAARQHKPTDARCDFVVNRDPDLHRFARATFDMVHSCLVLQHVPPDIALRYIAEFLRVTKPGGLVVFQLPAETRTQAQISAAHALPDAAYHAQIDLTDVPTAIPASAFADVHLRVTNRSDVTWDHDIPAGRHICLGNHWLREDGTRIVDDDGRARLTRPLAPGKTVEVVLRVQAPRAAGRYLLEIDLVQEHICWFTERGSQTARAIVDVHGPRPDVPREVSSRSASAVRPEGPRRQGFSLLRRLWRRLRGGAPVFEMHVVPRSTVEETIAAHGGQLIRVVDDNAAGPGWLSYTYICRRDGSRA